MKKLIIWSLFLITSGLYAQGDIYLSIPSDGELIEDESINFIWQASSMGSQEDPRLSQELVVSEMKNEQTPFEAVEVNAPILNKSHIQGANFFVSGTNFPFEPGKKYAWQIRYYMNGVPISRSECWWFEMKKPESKFLSYVPMRQKKDGQVLQLSEEQLNVSLITKGELNLEVIILSVEGDSWDGRLIEMYGTEELKEGESRSNNNSRNFILHFEDLKLTKGKYVMEWSPKKSELYTLTFELL